MENKSVIVIGAGPAGMMAAGVNASKGNNVIIIEKNNQVGKKLLITGKGRCNVTNNCNDSTFISNIVSNKQFLYSAINSFNAQSTINFFEKLGTELKTERGNRVFPKSDKSYDIVNCMNKFITNNNCKIINNEVISLIVENNIFKGVELENKETLFADKVIISTGGKSYPQTGSNGNGYKLAKQIGHTIITPKASLVPLTSPSNVCKFLKGLSLKNVAIKLFDSNSNLIYKDFGEMLFTHFGLSGPIIISASANIKDYNLNGYNCFIDLKPALSEKQLDERIKRDFLFNSNKYLNNSLNKLLPKKIIPTVIKLMEIDPKTKCNSITKEQRKKLINILKNFSIPIDGFRPIEEAIITRGGVNTSEINPKTMESKIIKNVYFAGEVIDVDAYTGGFNLQIAFSTGYLAGIS